MNIGEAAKLSGINSKLIRHYESIGVFPKVDRSESGYRLYTASDIHTLSFIKRAREMGFSMAEIKKLVSLWQTKSRFSSEVKALSEKHIKAMEQKIKALQQMVDTLRHLAKNCRGDGRPDCPIINELANTKK